MTQMDIIRQMIADGVLMQEVAEKYFPELRESEDEKIRKWCIAHFRECFRVTKDNTEYQEYLNNKVIPWLERQGGQVPAEKVEPKFKSGEWITFTREDATREILQVSDVIDGRYYFNHLLQFSWSVKECNERCHVWSLYDAKPGDVLAFKGEIFLFEEFLEDVTESTINYYFCCNGDYIITDHFYDFSSVDWLKISPATPRQRELLFLKMKEAGYEWDAEKLELKGI